MLTFRIEVDANEKSIPYLKELFLKIGGYVGHTTVVCENAWTPEMFEAMEKDAYDQGKLPL